MTVLDEVDNVAPVGCTAVTDSIMETLLGLVGVKLRRVVFPLTLTGSDSSGYFAQLTLAQPGDWPVMTYRYDPQNTGARIWLLPCTVSVSDAEGQKVDVMIVGDMKAGKIRVFASGDPLVH